MSNSANEQALIMQKKLLTKCLLVKPVAWNTTQVYANRTKQSFRHNQLLRGNPVKIIQEPLSK